MVQIDLKDPRQFCYDNHRIARVEFVRIADVIAVLLSAEVNQCERIARWLRPGLQTPPGERYPLVSSSRFLCCHDDVSAIACSLSTHAGGLACGDGRFQGLPR